MSDGKLIATGLFAVAIALGGISWTVHEHTVRHHRYLMNDLFRVDTLTGEIEVCKTQDDGMALCYRWADRTLDSFR